MELAVALESARLETAVGAVVSDPTVVVVVITLETEEVFGTSSEVLSAK